MGDISAPVTEFTTRWVQTSSDYDFLIASTLRREWVHDHQPVISRHKTGHQLYSKYNQDRPEGKVVWCNRCNGQPIDSRLIGGLVHLRCKGCGYTGRIPHWKSPQDTTLGAAGIVRAEYPPRVCDVQWWSPKERSLVTGIPTVQIHHPSAQPPLTPSPTPSNRKRPLVQEAHSVALKEKRKRIM